MLPACLLLLPIECSLCFLVGDYHKLILSSAERFTACLFSLAFLQKKSQQRISHNTVRTKGKLIAAVPLLINSHCLATWRSGLRYMSCHMLDSWQAQGSMNVSLKNGIAHTASCASFSFCFIISFSCLAWMASFLVPSKSPTIPWYFTSAFLASRRASWFFFIQVAVSSRSFLTWRFPVKVASTISSWHLTSGPEYLVEVILLLLQLNPLLFQLLLLFRYLRLRCSSGFAVLQASPIMLSILCRPLIHFGFWAHTATLYNQHQMKYIASWFSALP